MKKKQWLKIYLITLFCSVSLYGAEEQLIVTHRNARIFNEPSAFSPQLTRLPFGTSVLIGDRIGGWLLVSGPNMNGQGYIHVQALIDAKGFKRQAEDVNKRKDRLNSKGVKGFNENSEISAGVKGFDENSEVSAGVKGFDETGEVSAGAKGFDETGEVSAGAKGFNKDIEAEYKRKNKGLRYDLVDEFDYGNDVDDLQKAYQEFRRAGDLGEFGVYYYNPKKGSK